MGLTVRAQRGSELERVLSGRPHGFGVQMPRQAMTLWGEQCWGRAKERIRDDNPPRRTEGRGHVWELNVASFFQFRKWEIGTHVVPKCRGSQLRPLWSGPAHLSSLVPLLPSAPANPASHWRCNSCFPALVHAGHSARNTLPLAASFHFLTTAHLAPHLTSGHSFRSHLRKTLPKPLAQVGFPGCLVSPHSLPLHGT